MRRALAALILAFWSSASFAGEMWPDPDIPVPDLVRTFIAAECRDYAGTTHEGFNACVAGEGHGYRATVMMLSDPETGEQALERYRACRAGLGMHGGRFHRRRAECIGSSFKYVWRFESTRRASIPQSDRPFRTAVADGIR